LLFFTLWPKCIFGNIFKYYDDSVLKSIIKLGGEKLEWGRKVIETGFIALEKELDEKSIYSVGDKITMAGK